MNIPLISHSIKLYNIMSYIYLLYLFHLYLIVYPIISSHVMSPRIFHQYPFWLVVYLPLWNMSSSVGVIKFPTKFGKSFKIPWFQWPPTSLSYNTISDSKNTIHTRRLVVLPWKTLLIQVGHQALQLLFLQPWHPTELWGVKSLGK